MCYSAEASFVAAGGLSLIGALCVRDSKPGPTRWISVIPLCFAVQQCAEGIVWLHLDDDFERTTLSWLARSIYLFFAYVFWLTYLPFSMWRNEKVPWRRWTCLGLFGVALTGGIRNMEAILTLDWTPQILCQSIDYKQSTLEQMLTYGVIVFVPLLITTVPKMRIYGLLALLFYLVSYVFYLETFTSVWCFYAAVVSAFIYIVVKEPGVESELAQLQ